VLTLVQRLKAVVVAVAAAVDELLTGACRCVVQVGGLCCAAPTDRLGQEAFVCTSPCTSYQHSPSYHSIPSSTARRPSSGFYSATDSGAEYCDERVCVCVCVCVCPRSCLRNYTSDLHHVHVHHCDVHVTYGCGSVLLWHGRDTLRTSGFMDDVIFAHRPRLRRNSQAALGLRRNTRCRQRTHGTTSHSRIRWQDGAESAVYDCLVW